MSQLAQIQTLYSLIKEKSKTDEISSYTSQIFKKGINEMSKKLGEEAIEVAIAAIAQDDDCLKGEVVDLLYHLLCVLVYREISLEEIEQVIMDRNAASKDTTSTNK